MPNKNDDGFSDGAYMGTGKSLVVKVVFLVAVMAFTAGLITAIVSMFTEPEPTLPVKKSEVHICPEDQAFLLGSSNRLTDGVAHDCLPFKKARWT